MRFHSAGQQSRDRFGFVGGQNLFKEYADQMGKSGEEKFQLRGGDRVWKAPEDPIATWAPDNLPVAAIGNPFSHKVTASGGTGPFQFSLSDGALPPAWFTTATPASVHAATSTGSKPAAAGSAPTQKRQVRSS